MSELERLLDSSTSPAARALLRVGLADAPRAETPQRVAMALGLGAGAVAVAVPAAASVNTAAAVGGAAVALGKAPATASLSLLVLSKWLAAGVLGGLLVSGTVAVVEHTLPHATPLASPTPHAARRTATPPPLTPAPTAALNPVPDTPVAPTEAPLASAASVLGVSTAPAVASVPAASSSNSLGVEAARVDAARRALASGHWQQALAELDAYQRLRELGVLDREALLLRIQVLVEQGQGERAIGLAQSYLASHPNDAHAARLRALIANDGKVWPSAEGIGHEPSGH